MSIGPTREDKAHSAGFSEGLRMAALEIDTLTQQRDELKQQLAAAQLREKGYREALEKIAEAYSSPGMAQKVHGAREDWDIARAALAQPSDDKVLEAYVAERVKEIDELCGRRGRKKEINKRQEAAPDA